MKINDLILSVVVLLLAIAGWRIYREHFIFQGEDEELVLTKLSERASLIRACAKRLDIDPRLLASVIYAERRLNVSLIDSFEHIYAGLGHNSSMGFAQIRVNTAKWMIRTVRDSTSDYVLDPQYHTWLPIYEADEEVIKLLRDDSTNCLLASFHLKQIMQRWSRAGYDISARPDIVTTLYSYGLFHREDGREMLPHREPRSNFLGKVAASFYHSSKLREEFP